MNFVKTVMTAMAVCMSLGAWADKGALVLRAPKPEGCSAQVAYPSSNGVWATGGVFDGSTYQAYRWNTRNNEFEYLNTYGNFSFGFAVSNDGLVAGEYATSELLSNGATIESPCLWYGGKWHILDLGNLGNIDPEQPKSGAARNITPDGKYVVGALITTKGWEACYWELDANAKSSVKTLPMEEFGVAEHISANGSVIGGFDESGSIRMPVYWQQAGNAYNEVVPDGRKHTGMWTITCGVSPNGRYVATWNMLHDLQEGTKLQFDKDTNVDGATVAGVTSDGIVYGSGQVINAENGEYAFAAFYKDGLWVNAQTWLEEQGAVFGSDIRLRELRYISDDHKIFFANAAYADGLVGAVMIRLDENITSRPPVALKATQMSGLKAVRLTWKEPLANASAVQNYAVMRDGVEIFRGKAFQYTDRNCEIGKTYTYTVKAIYAGATSDDSDAAIVETTPLPLGAPSALSARHSGVNKVRLAWDGVGSSLSELKYYEEGRDIEGFGGGDWNIEGAVRFRYDDLKLFEDMQIYEVCFWPMSAQKEWTINFYRASDINGKPFYSEKLDASKLQYGSKNTIRLQNPVQIIENEDIVVGVCAMVNGSSYNVMGLLSADNEPGYNDLIRQPGNDFISLYEDGQENGYEYPYSWPISLGLSTIGGELTTLEGYNVYQDGEKVGSVDATTHKFLLPEVNDGIHQYEVNAYYTDARESATCETTILVKRNNNFFKVTEANVTPTENMLEATVEWKAPMDDERTMLGYSQEKKDHAVRTSANEGYSFQASCIYPQPMFKQYLDDYQISGVRFYPVGNAEFAFYLNSNGESLWEKELEREVDYELNKWNNYWLDEPIALDANSSDFQLIIDCYDGDANRDILAMDGMPANPYYSDLYSLDDGAEWASYEDKSGTRGNWLMGLILTVKDQKPMPVKNYVLTWDGEEQTTVSADAALSTTHTFTMTSSDEKRYEGNGRPFTSKHDVTITAVYDNGETWESSLFPIDWTLTPTAIVAPTAQSTGASLLYDMTGRKVTKANRGIYIQNGKKIVLP